MPSVLQNLTRKLFGTGLAPAPNHALPAVEGPAFDALKAHVIARLTETEIETAPFHHLWIETIFPEDWYARLIEHMQARKSEVRSAAPGAAGKAEAPAFTNRRISLLGCEDRVIREFVALWSDREVKRALFGRFYAGGVEDLVQTDLVHEKLEYSFSLPGRYQNIHVDIPPRVASFVFYLPSGPQDDATEAANGTILYGKDLTPVRHARYRANSACLFAGHYSSYYGYSAVTERDALVMFIEEPQEIDRWRRLSRSEDKPFQGTLQAIDEKLQRFPLVEYGTDPDRRRIEREACRINAPKGRVLAD